MFQQAILAEADQSDAPQPTIDSVTTPEGVFECEAVYKCSIDGDVYVRYPGLHKEKRDNVQCNYAELPSLQPTEVARRIAPERVYERLTTKQRHGFLYQCPFCNKKSRKYLIHNHMGNETCSLEGQAFSFLIPDKKSWPEAYKPIRLTE